MLILTRKKEESILIGKQIAVKVLDIEGERVKIGIEAPKDMKILRKELYCKVRDENIRALGLTKNNLNDVIELI